MARALYTLCTPFLMAVLWVSPAAAQLLDSPRAMGMGGATRGDPVGASAVVTNPAGMSRGMAYAVEGQVFRNAQSQSTVTGVNVVDSKTQPTLAVGAAYGYVFSDGSADVKYKGHDARLAFASAIIPNQLHVGVGGHYMTIERDPGEKLEGFTIDLGMLYQVSGNLNIGLVGQNLIEIDDPLIRRRLGGGVAVVASVLTIDGDLMYDMGKKGEDPKPDFSIGAEALLGKAIPLRVGYERLGRSQLQYISGGIGYTSTSGGARGNQLNMGYRANSEDPSDFTISAAITMFL